MIVETSALVAIFFKEIEEEEFINAILKESECFLSVANWLEFSIVLDRRGSPVVIDSMTSFLDRTRIQIVPVTMEQVQIARIAYQKFGKSNHPAKLNFGDCFSYALAHVMGGPLLCKGDDFRMTDLLLHPASA